jgi:hypothetical protein
MAQYPVHNLSARKRLFNVTAYANATTINCTEVTLPAGALRTVTILWNTTGFVINNYSISANADILQGETNMTNNYLVNGTITVTIPGDLNGYFKVSLADLILLANAYGANPSDIRWIVVSTRNADIDNNGKVGLSDLVILANHYGQHYP